MAQMSIRLVNLKIRGERERRATREYWLVLEESKLDDRNLRM